MSLERNLQSADSSPWDDLDRGLPMIRAFAELCAQCLNEHSSTSVDLSEEARVLLFLARRRGVIELRTASSAFQSADRLLAVQIELSESEHLALRHGEDARFTQRFLDGFRQLCAAGLVMHQFHDEFSLTHQGFELADSLDEADFAATLEEARSCGLQD